MLCILTFISYLKWGNSHQKMCGAKRSHFLMDFPHFKYEMNVKIHSIMLVLTRTKLRKQFCHCARSVSRRVRSRTWTAIRNLSYSTLSLGITRFWNFSNPLSGCKVTKFDPPLPPEGGQGGSKNLRVSNIGPKGANICYQTLLELLQ